jgi:hypothetical protein
MLLPRPGCGERVGARGIALSREAETLAQEKRRCPSRLNEFTICEVMQRVRRAIQKLALI